MADESDLIFREVDEEVRRDRLLALVKRYGPAVAGGIAILVVGVLGYRLWVEHRESRLRDASSRFQTVLEVTAESDPAAAARALEGAIGDLDGGYDLLARLHRAGALAQTGDLVQAATLYRRIAEDVSDTRLAAFARYLAASALLDSGGPDAAIAELSPLATPDSPIYHSALELLGAAYLRAGDVDAARSQFSAIVEDPAAPGGLRARAQDMLAVLGGGGDEAGTAIDEPGGAS